MLDSAYIHHERLANIESSPVWDNSSLAKLIYELISRQFLCGKYLKPVTIQYLQAARLAACLCMTLEVMPLLSASSICHAKRETIFIILNKIHLELLSWGQRLGNTRNIVCRYAFTRRSRLELGEESKGSGIPFTSLKVRSLHHLGNGSNTVNYAVVFGMSPLLSEELRPRVPEEAP